VSHETTALDIHKRREVRKGNYRTVLQRHIRSHETVYHESIQIISGFARQMLGPLRTFDYSMLKDCQNTFAREPPR